LWGRPSPVRRLDPLRQQQKNWRPLQAARW
jgi:hypothetical protein